MFNFYLDHPSNFDDYFYTMKNSNMTFFKIVPFQKIIHGVTVSMCFSFIICV